MPTTVVLRAPAISCGHCVATIKNAVGKLAGVSAVEGDPSTKEIRVTYDPAEVSPAVIEATMAEIGYPVAS